MKGSSCKSKQGSFMCAVCTAMNVAESLKRMASALSEERISIAELIISSKPHAMCSGILGMVCRTYALQFCVIYQLPYQN